MHIVLIDDDPTDRWVMLRELRRLSAQIAISECDSVDAAIKELSVSKPDVALLDIQMPGTSGLEGYDSIRAASQETTIYFLSGSNSDRDKQEANNLGADGYFVKPSSLKGFSELASSILNGSDEAKQEAQEEARRRQMRR